MRRHTAVAENGSLSENPSSAVVLVAVGNRTFESAGKINGKALGYVYGFIDAALRTIGQNMSDNAIGIPITYQILRRVCPGREDVYLSYLAEGIGTDTDLMQGLMMGGQQYLDFNSGKLAAPMGLAQCLLDAP